MGSRRSVQRDDCPADPIRDSRRHLVPGRGEWRRTSSTLCASLSNHDSDWRRNWDEGDFPFLFVQIANWSTGPDANWPEVRDAQRQALALRNTGMAVTIDIGDPVDIHPKNKLDVGLRLALAARAIAYGEKVEWSGPLYRQLTQEDHALRVWFDHANGLAAKGGALVGFEIAGADGKYVSADATIEGSSVVVSSAAVTNPVSVRYGWAASPTCNLVNKEGLPASPFRAAE